MKNLLLKSCRVGIFLLLSIGITFSVLASDSSTGSDSSSGSSTSTTSSSSSTSSANGTVVCTQEYAPVCGKVKLYLQDSTAQYSYITRTFPNKCTLSASSAEFLYEGECKSTAPVCPAYTTPEPKDLCTITRQTDSNGCKKPVQTCVESPKNCTQEYAPVCGKKKLSECCGATTGATIPDYCKTVKVSCELQEKTFPNKCSMDAAGAIISHE
jgi:hypothetical protein